MNGRNGTGRRTRIAWWCFAAIAALLLFSGHLTAGQPGAVRQKITFVPSGASVIAEKADSPEKRTRGLMFRTSLGETEGMIFYFGQPGRHPFWMHNTRIPLTVIFLDDALRIVDMRNMSPCLERDPDRCPIYAPGADAGYAVEVNQGFVGKHRIKIGDHVIIEEVR